MPMLRRLLYLHDRVGHIDEMTIICRISQKLQLWVTSKMKGTAAEREAIAHPKTNLVRR